jgi:hypothetical protein
LTARAAAVRWTDDARHLARIVMSSEAAPSTDRQQQKLKEFMSLLPLTVEIAGLPPGDATKHFNEGQMEVRASSLKLAFKIARQMALEIQSK